MVSSNLSSAAIIGPARTAKVPTGKRALRLPLPAAHRPTSVAWRDAGEAASDGGVAADPRSAERPAADGRDRRRRAPQARPAKRCRRNAPRGSRVPTQRLVGYACEECDAAQGVAEVADQIYKESFTGHAPPAAISHRRTSGATPAPSANGGRV